MKKEMFFVKPAPDRTKPQYHLEDKWYPARLTERDHEGNPHAFDLMEPDNPDQEKLHYCLVKHCGYLGGFDWKISFNDVSRNTETWQAPL